MKYEKIDLKDGRKGIVIDGILQLNPFVTWSAAVTPFGCFSTCINYFTLFTKDLINPRDGKSYVVPRKSAGVPTIRVPDDVYDVMTALNVDLYGPSLDRTIGQPEDSELAYALFEVGMDNSWEGFITTYGRSGLVLWGDHLGSHGYYTKYMGRYLQTRGIGALSSTHAVVNPAYPGSPKPCRVWAWTPPDNTPMTLPVGETYGVKPRSKTELLGNIKKGWGAACEKIYANPVLINFEPDEELSARKVV